MEDAQCRAGVILAGGSGERFWPLSRRNRPKQLLRLTAPDRTMLQEAADRLAPLIPRERLYVVTGRHLADAIRDGGLDIPPENILAEPCKRNTAGALAYTSAHLLATTGKHPEDITLAVTTADHIIGDDTRFTDAAEAALDAAESHRALVTFGVVATRPETGYGYIQARGEPAVNPKTGVQVYAVGAFHEKPSRERAEDFIEAGNYYWNSGMFFWRMSSFLDELALTRPELARSIEALTGALRHGNASDTDRIFNELEDISIDYALMEHARRVLMVRADFPWDDMGAWQALDRTLAHDAQGNVLEGDPVAVDCKDCIIYNEAGPGSMAVGVVGMQDVVVVATGDAVLVMPKSRSQDVRRVVSALRKRNATQY
jgi:mannose-1-phosphate guanylyltransferase